MKKGWQAERWRKLIWFPDRSETEVRADQRDTKEKKWLHFFPSSRCRSPCFCNTDLKSQPAAFMNSSKPSEVWNLGHSEAASPPFQNHFAHFYEAAACLFCWCASDLRPWTGERGGGPTSVTQEQSVQCSTPCRTHRLQPETLISSSWLIFIFIKWN